MTTPQEDTELIRELDTLIIAHNQYIDNVWKGSADLKNPPETSEKILALIKARDEQREREIYKDVFMLLTHPRYTYETALRIIKARANLTNPQEQDKGFVCLEEDDYKECM